MVTLAVALLAGYNGIAMANGTEMPAPETKTYTPAPAPEPAPAPAPVYRPAPAPVASLSNEGPYVSASVGIGIPQDVKVANANTEMDRTWVLNGALGYRFDSVRAEAAVGYQKYDVTNGSGDASLLTVMGNAYYDFDSGSGVKPYIMGGAGMARVHVSSGDNDNVFAWQVGAGLGFKVADNTTLDLGYRYLKPSDFNINGNSASWAVHNAMLGLRYQF